MIVSLRGHGRNSRAIRKGMKRLITARLKGRYVVIQSDNRRVPIEWSSRSGMDKRFITLPLPEMETSWAVR